MTKDNILFAIIGLLAGLLIGFFGANYLNKNAPAPAPQSGLSAAKISG